MGWTGRFLCFVAAVGGLAAAHGIGGAGYALVLPTAPTVTVTVPTLPPPLPPPPTTTAVQVPPPPVPLPPPPAPVPPPPTSVEVPPVTQAPAPVVVEPAPAPAPIQRAVTPPPVVGSAATPSSPRPDAGAAAASPAPAGAAQPSGAPTSSADDGKAERRPAAATRRQRLQAKTQRSKERVRVKLEFTLAEARRVFLIVRGPAPSCRIAGVIPFRGRKGQNAATFAGRVRGRRLEPGVYLLSLSPKRRLVPSAPTEYVRVASPRRTVPLADDARKPTCPAAQALAGDSTFRFLADEPRQELSVPGVRPFRPAAPFRPPLSPLAPGVESDGEDSFPGIPSPGEIGIAADGSLGETLVTIGVLVVINILLMAMLGLAARFLRGSWSP